MKEKSALAQAFDYYDAVVRSDINRADGINKNPETVKLLMRSYARNLGTSVSNSLLRSDMISNDAETLSVDTVISYVNA